MKGPTCLNISGYRFFLIILCVVFTLHSCQDKHKSEEKALTSSQTSLIDLCPKYGTDKCADRHNFIEFYQALFEPIKDSVTNVLEIGILNARSHLMWQEYFVNAEIYGIDINDCSRYDSLGIKTFIADQSNRIDLAAFTDRFPGPYDIIIDDGGHHMDQQQISLGYFFKFLKPGGLYIIEDLHTSTPYYYNAYDGFGVDEEASNTTLSMLEKYLIQNIWESKFMTEKELANIQSEIGTVSILRRDNEWRSMMGVLKKID